MSVKRCQKSVVSMKWSVVSGQWSVVSILDCKIFVVKNLFCDGEGWWSLNCDGVDGPIQFRIDEELFFFPGLHPVLLSYI